MSTHVEKFDLVYIVNLTTNMWGKGFIRELIASEELAYKASQFFSRLTPQGMWFYSRIAKQIREMSGEVLGRIACYGTSEGIHQPSEGVNRPEFISITGGYHIVPYWQQGAQFRYASREALEEMAYRVLVCILRDIVCQKTWQLLWKKKDWESLARAMKMDKEPDDSFRD